MLYQTMVSSSSSTAAFSIQNWAPFLRPVRRAPPLRFIDPDRSSTSARRVVGLSTVQVGATQPAGAAVLAGPDVAGAPAARSPYPVASVIVFQQASA